MLIRALPILLAICLCGCPSEADEAQVVDQCTKSTQRCRIGGGGQLGVCMMEPDGSFVCAPQH